MPGLQRILQLPARTTSRSLRNRLLPMSPSASPSKPLFLSLIERHSFRFTSSNVSHAIDPHAERERQRSVVGRADEDRVFTAFFEPDRVRAATFFPQQDRVTEPAAAFHLDTDVGPGAECQNYLLA